MKVQILLVLIFALNIILIWSAAKYKWLIWYTCLGGLVFVLLPLFGVFFTQPYFVLDHFWWQVVGILAILVGMSVIAWAIMAQKTSGCSLCGLSEKFVPSGPYRFVRHPLYLGLIFIYIGWWWIWATVYSFYFGMLIVLLIWLQAWLEEKYLLENKYGQAYSAYKKNTGMFWIK
ncbi:MAG: isoprenylcysteine carboxylmethyltransferase family protein [Candidatus Margulisiibacteriota bacterium]